MSLARGALLGLEGDGEALVGTALELEHGGLGVERQERQRRHVVVVESEIDRAALDLKHAAGRLAEFLEDDEDVHGLGIHPREVPDDRAGLGRLRPASLVGDDTTRWNRLRIEAEREGPVEARPPRLD